MTIAGKRVEKRHIKGPIGVRGRNSDNCLIEEKLGWKPSEPLSAGLAVTYEWIERQVLAKAGYAPSAGPDSVSQLRPRERARVEAPEPRRYAMQS